MWTRGDNRKVYAMYVSVGCVCCREIVIILAKIDRQDDSVLCASQSMEDLNLNASTCGSFKLHICTSNIGWNMGLHE